MRAMTESVDNPSLAREWRARLPRIEFAFFVVVLALCVLHLLRNISMAFPLAYLGAALLLFLLSLRRLKIRISQIVIVFCYAYVALLTIYYSQIYGDPSTGLIRLAYLLPVVLYLFGPRLGDRQCEFTWKFLAGFSVLAASSIFYQFLAGPIWWFAEASERAGSVRFASLAGSLTAFGSIVGPACFLVWVLGTSLQTRIGLVGVLLLASALSLQKAAVVSVVLGIALGIIASVSGKRGVLALAWGAVLSVVVAVGAWFVFAGLLPGEVRKPIEVFLGGAIGRPGSGDVTLGESIIQRWTDLPAASVAYFGQQSLITGIGAYGAAGALGYPDLPMMHNLLGEILIVGGIGVFAVFAVVTVVAACRAVRVLSSSASFTRRIRLAAGVLLLTLAVGLHTGSVYFHPVIGLFYWLSLRELVVDWKFGKLYAQRSGRTA